jgi:hypothetical protein
MLKYTAYIEPTTSIKFRTGLHTLISFNDNSVPLELIQSMGFESPTIATEFNPDIKKSGCVWATLYYQVHIPHLLSIIVS